MNKCEFLFADCKVKHYFLFFKFFYKNFSFVGKSFQNIR